MIFIYIVSEYAVVNDFLKENQIPLHGLFFGVNCMGMFLDFLLKLDTGSHSLSYHLKKEVNFGKDMTNESEAKFQSQDVCHICSKGGFLTLPEARSKSVIQDDILEPKDKEKLDALLAESCVETDLDSTEEYDKYNEYGVTGDESQDNHSDYDEYAEYGFSPDEFKEDSNLKKKVDDPMKNPLCLVKVRDHDHFIEHDNFIGASHSWCNLQRNKNHFKIAVISHNGSGYDWHLSIKHLSTIWNQKIKLKPIPKSDTDLVAFDYGTFKFIDSFRFLSEKLEKLVNQNANRIEDEDGVLDVCKENVSPHIFPNTYSFFVNLDKDNITRIGKITRKKVSLRNIWPRLKN